LILEIHARASSSATSGIANPKQIIIEPYPTAQILGET